MVQQEKRVLFFLSFICLSCKICSVWCCVLVSVASIGCSDDNIALLSFLNDNCLDQHDSHKDGLHPFWC